MSCPVEGDMPVSPLLDPPDDLSSPRLASARASHILYTETNIMSHLNDAIQDFSDSAPLPPFAAAQLSTCHGERYQKLHNLHDLQQAIKYAEAAVAAGHTTGKLGALLKLRYESTGSIDDLDTAILHFSTAAAAADSQAYRSQLAECRELRFKRFGELADLQHVILHSEAELSATPETHIDRAANLARLSMNMAQRYKRVGEAGDLQRAVEYARGAVDATPIGHPDRGKHLGILAAHMRSSYQLRDVLDVPQEMRDMAPPPPRPIHPERQGFMASILNRMHSTYGPMEELDTGRAMLYCAGAWIEGPRESSDPEGFLTNLYARLRSRYERQEDIDPQDAIECCRAAWAETPQDHLDRGGFQSNLAPTPHDTYQRLGQLDELQQTVQYYEEALAATPQTDPNYLHLMSNLAGTLCDRYRRMDSLADLQRAVLYDEEVLATVPHNHPERPLYLCNAANNLSTRHQHIGDLDDLQQAILYATAAIDAWPADHPDRARYWILLSEQLVTACMRRKDLGKLSRAISYAEQALEVTPVDHPARKQYLHHLAIAVGQRYCHVGDTADSTRAISYVMELLQTMPQEQPQERAAPLSTLCMVLMQRYIRERKLEYIQDAIQYAEEAATIMPQYDPNRAKLLLCLAMMLHERADITSAWVDETAILAIYREAWGCRNSPPSIRIIAARQAVKYLLRDFRFEEASLLLQDCVQMLQMVSPRSLRQEDREFKLGELSGLAGDTASGILQQGRALRGLATGRDLGVRFLRWITRRERERKGLPERPADDPEKPPPALVGLARGTAAGTLVWKEAAYHALKFLELGRGTIMSSAIDCRSDLSDLKVMHPELAERFDSVRTEIDTPPPNRITGGTVGESESLFTTAAAYHLCRTHASRDREAAVREMEDMLAQIRKLPGHTGFQLPPSAEELMAMAKDGPIVTFVASSINSEAIIVTSTAITSLNLLNLAFGEILARLACITKNTAKKASKKSSTKPTRVSPRRAIQEYAERNEQMRELLLWLWDVAVEPVLQNLGLTQPTGTELPHIWWIGVGPLSMAPFHAAGDHSPGSSRNTISCVISSYTPTIKALLYARERELDLISNPDAQLLLVTMPKTPGEKDLLDVEREVSEIVNITTGLIAAKHLERPSANQVLEHFQAGTYNAMHFACHGISDTKEPSKSHLVLLKDPTDSQPPGSETADRLTVQNISQTNTKAGQLAYLSACSTARNSVIALADETILIASGFQLAGFSHVLATLWPSESDVCKEVAIDFYRSLFNGQDKGVGHRKVSMAFHEATKRARDKDPLLPPALNPVGDYIDGLNVGDESSKGALMRLDE